MKRIFKRNQVIITSLVIMIIIAGYLNFTADRVTNAAQAGDMNVISQQADDSGNLNEEYLIDVDVAPEEDLSMVMDDDGDLSAKETIADDIGEVEDIGEAVLTSTNSPTAVNFSAAARLSREQTRSQNKETLQEMIDNQNVAEDLRATAANDLMNLTKISEKELAVETMLEAKGFANSVVSISDGSVDVVICLETLTDGQKAQIEDIVMRKAEVAADKIVITTLKNE